MGLEVRPKPFAGPNAQGVALRRQDDCQTDKWHGLGKQDKYICVEFDLQPYRLLGTLAAQGLKDKAN